MSLLFEMEDGRKVTGLTPEEWAAAYNALPIQDQKVERAHPIAVRGWMAFTTGGETFFHMPSGDEDLTIEYLEKHENLRRVRPADKE